MVHSILSDTKVVQALAACPGTVGAQTPVEVDATGFRRACFILTLGTASTGGKLDAKVQKSDTTGGTFSDITGAALTQVTKAAGDNKVEIIDVSVPGASVFLNLVVTTSTADFPVGAVCILHQGDGPLPYTQGAVQTIVK